MQPDTTFEEERPTTPTAHTPSKLVTFAVRVERHVENALDCIRSGDPSAAALALVQLQALTSGVLR